MGSRSGQPFLPEYLGLVRDHYGAGLEEVDFQHATEQAGRTINAWVEKQTEDKIKDLEDILKTYELHANGRIIAFLAEDLKDIKMMFPPIKASSPANIGRFQGVISPNTPTASR